MTTNSNTVKTAAGLVRASHKAFAKKWSFLFLFVFMLFLSISTASALDVLPDPQPATVAKQPTAALAAEPIVAASAPELPAKIQIPAIKLSQTISNPDTTNVELLDNALLKGPARYPTSAKLGEQGNMILFGHSSYLPIVNNKAFKAFDGIQNLKKGDLITVTGESHTYVYSVETVEKESALDDSIPLDVSGSQLTLATCNSFGEKSDRFVVTATLVETNPL